MEKNQKIEELVAQLNEAADAYYSGKDELMSNYEWDAAFDELKKLEEETGYTSVNLVNNLCARYGLEKAYSGSSERAEYGDYAIRLTSEIFEGRVR